MNHLTAFFKSLFETFIFFGIVLIAGLIVSLVPFVIANGDTSFFEGDHYHSPEISILSQGVLLLAVLLALLFCNHTIYKEDTLRLRFNWFSRDSFEGLLLGTMPMVATVLTLHIAGLIKFSYTSPGLPFLYLFIYMVLVAVVEEILMRGVVLRIFLKRFHITWAIATSSLVFGILHAWNSHAGWIGILNISLSGVLMGIIYIRQMNILAPIAMHLMWNFVQGPVFGFAVSGHATKSLVLPELTGEEFLTGGNFGLEGSVVATGILLLSVAGYWYKCFALKR